MSTHGAGGLRVAVVGGGANSEHAVSLASADAAQKALVEWGHDVLRLDLGREGGWCRGLDRVSPADALALVAACDVLLPLVHGPGGEDGTLAALGPLLGVRVVGSGVGAGALGMDKWATKLVAGAVGVRVAAGCLVRPGDVVEWDAPVVVKPVAAGSSNGVSLVERSEDLPGALAAAFAEDDRVLVEEVVRGREVDVTVVRRADGLLLVTPPLEVHADGFFDYDAKYGGGVRFEVPAPLTRDEATSLAVAARAVYEALGCAGVARVDFFLTDGGWVLNEVNTVPGMTPLSQVPLMAEAAGLSYGDLLDELVRAAR